MFIELKEINLPIDGVHKRESYIEPGLFLANDGVAHFIVCVFEESKSVTSIPVPFELLKTGIINNAKTELTKEISNMFDTICEKMTNEVSGLKECIESYKAQKKSIEKGFVSSETLLDAIRIVANNPK